MNKRAMLHELLDKVMDIEETSKKGVVFEYSTLHNVALRFKTRPVAGASYVLDGCGFNFFNMNEAEFRSALDVIETINIAPDVEPKFSFTLDESKARELGLIA